MAGSVLGAWVQLWLGMKITKNPDLNRVSYQQGEIDKSNKQVHDIVMGRCDVVVWEDDGQLQY